MILISATEYSMLLNVMFPLWDIDKRLKYYCILTILTGDFNWFIIAEGTLAFDCLEHFIIDWVVDHPSNYFFLYRQTDTDTYKWKTVYRESK